MESRTSPLTMSRGGRYLGRHRAPHFVGTAFSALAVATLLASGGLATTGSVERQATPRLSAAVAEHDISSVDRANRNQRESPVKTSRKPPVASLPNSRAAKDMPEWIAPSPAILSDTFGPRGWRNGEMHYGIDFAADEGQANYAAHAGTVLQAGKNGGYGKSVIIDNGKSILTIYGHHSKLSVKAGDKVKVGDEIGLAGHTGDATGPHLHFEVLAHDKRLDPQTFLVGKNIPL